MKIKLIKHLGQNFLIDKNILEKIIATADIKPNDVILEIGPGTGILTLELAKYAKRVIAVEKDKRMCEFLKNVLIAQNVRNVEIINEDILNYVGRAMSYIKGYKLVANLPYYITSPVIRKFLETPNKPKLMVLMVQKEVAQRICAKPGKMSLLAVAVQFYAKPEIIAYVSKNAFYPVPKVDSAIIKITPRPDVGHAMSYIDAKKFFDLVKRGFLAKRKMLKNNIPNINFEKIGLNPKCRAEELSVDDWVRLYTILTNKKVI